MKNAENTIEKFRQLEILSEGTTFIHKSHPLIKLVTTVIYLTVVISFQPYEVISLLPYVIYIVVIKEIAEIPFSIIWDRFKIVLPLIIGMGIFNPLLDTNRLILSFGSISMGWISLTSLMIKGALTVSAMILLIATTGINGITYALKQLNIPSFFLMTFNMIYRYIGILLEEIFRMSLAYSLKSKQNKGIRIREWGSFAGNLLLRTIDRAEQVHNAMMARGFSGHFYLKSYRKIKLIDMMYLLFWAAFFIGFKIWSL